MAKPKTRQVNFRLDEKALSELRDLADVMGESTSDTLRVLIMKAYAKITPSMFAELEKRRERERSVRAKILG